MFTQNIEILLASQSPRRYELLTSCGFQVQKIKIDVEEIFPQELAVEKVAEYIARLKGNATKDIELKPHQIILTSDTVVVLDNTILGKPKDEKEAFSMLSSLSDKTHQVISGVYLRSYQKELSFSSTTEVSFGKLSNELIHHYIKTCQPFDKAGAYAIQEMIGMSGIKGINGDYYSVVGLPMYQTIQQIQSLFNTK